MKKFVHDSYSLLFLHDKISLTDERPFHSTPTPCPPHETYECINKLSGKLLNSRKDAKFSLCVFASLREIQRQLFSAPQSMDRFKIAHRVCYSHLECIRFKRRENYETTPCDFRTIWFAHFA